MNFPFIDKKSIARQLRIRADELDPPKNKFKRVESRLDKIKVLANAKPFDEAEAVQAIGAIYVNANQCIHVNVYTRHSLNLIHADIRRQIEIIQSRN